MMMVMMVVGGDDDDDDDDDNFGDDRIMIVATVWLFLSHCFCPNFHSVHESHFVAACCSVVFLLAWSITTMPKLSLLQEQLTQILEKLQCHVRKKMLGNVAKLLGCPRKLVNGLMGYNPNILIYK